MKRWTPFCILLLVSFPIMTAWSGDFTVHVQRASSDAYNLSYTGETGVYYQVHRTSSPTGEWSVVDMHPGEDSELVWTNDDFYSSEDDFRLYRIRKVPNDSPTDVDSDGMDDLYEMNWPFLNPLDSADAQQDQDQDGLYNYGEYLYDCNPTNKDSDADWAGDGYEVYSSTHPANSSSTPTLELRINGGALYTADTNLSLVFGGLVADDVRTAESISLANSTTNPLSMPVDYSLPSDENRWRTLYAKLHRDSDDAVSPVIAASIILDTLPPTLSIVSPTNEQITTRSWIMVTGTVYDAAATPVVYVNGEWADAVSQNGFLKQQVALESGSNTITVTASDGAGHTVTQQIVVVQDTSGDTTAPALALEISSDFEIDGDTTNWLSTTTLGSNDWIDMHGWTDDDNADIDFFVIDSLVTNGPYAGTLSGTQFWGEILISPGTNVIQARATDAAGNTATAACTIVSDWSFFFNITSPAAGAVIGTTQIVVSGEASPIFSNATISVNGIAVSATSDSNRVSFTTTSPVPVSPGLTPLEGLAVLEGRSYYTDPPVQSFSHTRWHRDYSNHYSSLYWNAYGDHFTVEGWWTRDDQWLSSTGKLVARHWQDVEYCDYIMGGRECNHDIRDETTITEQSTPITYGFFGTEHIQYNYTVLGGLQAWDQDITDIHDELNFIRHAAGSDAGAPVLMQFSGLSYLRPDGTSVDPSLVTFRGSTGFWHNSQVAFYADMPCGIDHQVSEADFTWPSFHYFGERKDRREWYEASTRTKAHLLSFADFSYTPIEVKIKAAGFVSAPALSTIMPLWTGTGRDRMVMAFPEGTVSNKHAWKATVTPAVSGTFQILVDRGGVTSPVSWSGSAPSLTFENGTSSCSVILLDGAGVTPEATLEGTTVYVANMKATDRIIARHAESRAEDSALVVRNFTVTDAETLGLENLSFAPELAGLSPLVRSNIMNTIRYSLDRGTGSEQAQERDAMQLQHPPLSAQNIPSTMGVGTLPSDLMHLHVTIISNNVPAALAQAKQDYSTTEQALVQALGASSAAYYRKSARDRLAALRDGMASDFVSLMNAIASYPEVVFVYHSYEWINDGYGGFERLQPGDPIRNLMTNLSATDTNQYGSSNDPTVMYPGSATDANEVYTTYNLQRFVDLKFFIDANGQIHVTASPLSGSDGAIRALQLHELLGE